MATNIVKTQKPDILDDAVAEILKIPAAVGNTRAGKMCLSASGIIYWRGRGPEPDPMRKAIAEELLRWLNKEVWLDGQWVVCWCDFRLETACYTRLAWCFLDKDNDLLFEVETDEPPEVIMLTIPDRVEHAMQAWMEWKQTMQDVGVRPEHTIKAALGQKSADPTAQPSIDLLALD